MGALSGVRADVSSERVRHMASSSYGCIRERPIPKGNPSLSNEGPVGLCPKGVKVQTSEQVQVNVKPEGHIASNPVEDQALNRQPNGSAMSSTHVGQALPKYTMGDNHLGEVELHEVIKQSGKPNMLGCRIPLDTRWNIEFLETELREYQDSQVVDLCKFGWPINVTDEQFADRGRPKNWRSALDFPEQMDQYIQREIQEGSLLGPFEISPFKSTPVFSPLSTTPKRGSSERRVIMDLSFPPGNSVSDKIPKDQYLGQERKLTYPSVDALVELVRKKGQGCALMKCDLRRAYKQIHTDPGDWNLLGLTWRGKIYFDKTLPMGLRSAAMCCQRITNAIKFMVEARGYDLVSYLDDMVSAEVWDLANNCFLVLRQVIAMSGAEESEEKAVSPCTSMLFLGILFNTVDLTLRIDQERLQEILELLQGWLGMTHMSRKEVEKVAGKLGFVSACVRPGRLFVSRILQFLRGLPRVGKFPISDEFRKDLLWWSHFLPGYNGVSMMPQEDWSYPDEVVASDACLEGCGAWHCGTQEFFHLQFPGFVREKQLCINSLETLTVVVAAKLWGKNWRGKRIVIHCDNAASVSIINTGRSHSTFLQSCLRELEFVAAKYEFEIRANHIRGVDNRIPDALSRWHMGSQFMEAFLEPSGRFEGQKGI